MEKNSQIGGQEYLSMLIVVMTSIVFFNTPRRFFLLNANAAWLSVLISIFATLVAVTLIGMFLRRHPGKGLTDLAVMTLGSFLGSLVNMLFFAYFLIVAALNIRLLGESIVMTALPEIPVSVIVLSTTIFTVYACLQGWNVIAKTCWVSLPFLAVGVVLPLVLTADRWNTNYLYPLLGNGLQATIITGVGGAGILGEIVLAAILAQVVQPEVKVWRTSMTAVLASGLLFLMVVLATSMVFPYPIAGQLTLPYYMLSRTLTLGRFLQRMEALALIIWAFAALIKVSIDSYAALYIYKRIFGVKDQKPLLLPHGVIIFATAMIPNSFLATTNSIWVWVRLYGGIVSLVIPILIALIGLIRLKPTTGSEANT